jgi:DeoR/GlpR family transcriptional regulator of sugar metabolism
MIQPPRAEVTEGSVMPFVEPRATFEAASGQLVEELEKAARITVEVVTRHELVTADGCTCTYALVQFVFDAKTGIFVSSSTLNYFATLDPRYKYVDHFANFFTVG